MKKFLFSAAAILMMASCTNDALVEEAKAPTTTSEGSAISFGTIYKGTTRADFTGADAAAKLGNNFVVMGMKSNGTIAATDAPVFDHYNVNWVTNTANTTTSNTSDWEYVAQPKHAHSDAGAQYIKYWDYATTQYDFIAYSKGLATAVYADAEYVAGTNVLFTEITPSTMATSAYTVKGQAKDLAKVYIADLVTAYRDASPSDYQNEVNIKFRSLSAKVRVALYETVPGYSVKDVVFYTDASTAATDGKAHLYTTGDDDKFYEEGTYTVYYPTTGSANVNETDYNKAHITFAPVTSGTSKVKEFGTLANFQSTEPGCFEAADDYLGRNSSEATYADPDESDATDNYYTIVIPNETGVVLNLKVNYTLVSTDGSGEEINVTGATAQVPAVYATWKSGYAYTYIFKISQNTNGYTGPNTQPAGLYPITFDAVVMNNEVDGIQETITTVATPSITTYAKGEVVTDNDEYQVGNTIYAIVANGTALTVGTNANLYTVTLETGAAQTINEASVANAIANGKPAYDDGEVLAADTPLDGYYTLSGSVYTACGSTDVADGTTTYYKQTSLYVVKDANGKKMEVKAADGLTAVSEIAAADAPDGNAITVNGAKFTPSAAGTYVFEYISGTDKYYKIIKVVAAP